MSAVCPDSPQLLARLEVCAYRYRYHGYFCSYSNKVTICVTGDCGPFLPTRATLPCRAVPGSKFSVNTDWSSRNVPEAGRPSRQREDHHPRAVAASDEGAAREQLPPRQRLGEVELPHR